MVRGTLLPSTSEVELVCLRPRVGLNEVELRAAKAASCCPVCGTGSRRVHSRYVRKLGDLPWEGIPVSILLQTRRFFCVVETCRRRIFTEPLPGTVLRYSRRTLRSCEALGWITVMIGGQAGARLAHRLGLLVSGSTLLRELRCRARRAPVVAPRVLGIDDWAWRKGHRYGTILCDLESRRVIDLLPDREAATVATWLREHPGSEIVSRDRGGIYAQATRQAAPAAVQVADRWHLLRNLSEALKNALSPHHRLLTQVARSSTGETATVVAVPQPSVPPWELRAQQKNRDRRFSRYEEVRRLGQTGASHASIGRQLGLDHRTVRKFLRADIFPEAQRSPRPGIVDPYAEYLDRRLEQGCRNISQLWRELREQGFTGQFNVVRRWIRCRPEIEMQLKQPSSCPGVRARWKGTSIVSSSSSARCTVVQASTCCACASSTRDENWHSEHHAKAKTLLHQM